MTKEINEQSEVDELAGLGVLGKVYVQAILTSHVGLGGAFKRAQQLLNKKDFKIWSTENYGSQFYAIADRLMRAHDIFSANNIPLPEMTSDTFLSIMRKDIPDATITNIARENSVEVAGKTKKLQDLTRIDLAAIAARSETLEVLLQEKVSEINELEDEVDELKNKIGTMEEHGTTEEIATLQRLLAEREKEIIALRTKKKTDQQKEKKQAIINLLTRLDSIFLSHEADALEAFSAALLENDKDLIRATVDSHQQKLRQFRQKMGIPE